jgi:hypothetical protein
MLLTMNSGNTADRMHRLYLYACGWVLPALFSGKAKADAGNEAVSGASFSRSDVYCDSFCGELLTRRRNQVESAEAVISERFQLVVDAPFVLYKSWSGAAC